MNTIGFIGTGNMGGALARAAAKAVAADNIFLANRTMEKAGALAADLGCHVVTVSEIADKCHLIFLGVKPQMMAGLLQRIAPILHCRTTPFTLVSMAAGITTADIQKMAGNTYPVIRIMPNIPVRCGSGVVLYCATENVPEEDLSAFRWAMSHAGLVDSLSEHLMDAGSALSGCGPAFVSMFIEALADGAVRCGLTRQQATAYACQTLIGTANLLNETGIHPGALKDAVCSPGGSTICGVAALEQANFRAAVIDAIDKAYKKNQELGK